MSNTLNERVALFTTKQQEYICYCIKKWTSSNENFHRGMLPMTTVKTIYMCLVSEHVHSPAAHSDRKFLKNLISVTSRLLAEPIKLCKDEEKVKMQLTDKRLSRRFGKRLKSKCEVPCPVAPHSEGLIGLKSIIQNKWEVTASIRDIDAVTTWLREL